MARITQVIKTFSSYLFNRREIKVHAYPTAASDYAPPPLTGEPLVKASDIPVAYTPEGGYRRTFPAPVLADCTEPLSVDAPDLRGVWLCYKGRMKGHVERIEQSGNRVVITAGGVIHDMKVDGTLENGVHDVNRLGEVHVAADFKKGQLQLRPNGKRLIAVRRYLDGDDLIWWYGPFKNRLRRVEKPLEEWNS